MIADGLAFNSGICFLDSDRIHIHCLNCGLLVLRVNNSLYDRLHRRDIDLFVVHFHGSKGLRGGKQTTKLPF